MIVRFSLWQENNWQTLDRQLETFTTTISNWDIPSMNIRLQISSATQQIFKWSRRMSSECPLKKISSNAANHWEGSSIWIFGNHRDSTPKKTSNYSIFSEKLMRAINVQSLRATPNLLPEEHPTLISASKTPSLSRSWVLLH